MHVAELVLKVHQPSHPGSDEIGGRDGLLQDRGYTLPLQLLSECTYSSGGAQDRRDQD